MTYVPDRDTGKNKKIYNIIVNC